MLMLKSTKWYPNKGTIHFPDDSLSIIVYSYWLDVTKVIKYKFLVHKKEIVFYFTSLLLLWQKRLGGEEFSFWICIVILIIVYYKTRYPVCVYYCYCQHRLNISTILSISISIRTRCPFHCVAADFDRADLYRQLSITISGIS